MDMTKFKTRSSSALELYVKPEILHATLEMVNVCYQATRVNNDYQSERIFEKLFLSFWDARDVEGALNCQLTFEHFKKDKTLSINSVTLHTSRIPNA